MNQNEARRRSPARPKGKAAIPKLVAGNKEKKSKRVKTLRSPHSLPTPHQGGSRKRRSIHHGTGNGTRPPAAAAPATLDELGAAPSAMGAHLAVQVPPPSPPAGFSPLEAAVRLHSMPGRLVLGERGFQRVGSESPSQYLGSLCLSPKDRRRPDSATRWPSPRAPSHLSSSFLLPADQSANVGADQSEKLSAPDTRPSGSDPVEPHDSATGATSKGTWASLGGTKGLEVDASADWRVSCSLQLPRALEEGLAQRQAQSALNLGACAFVSKPFSGRTAADGSPVARPLPLGFPSSSSAGCRHAQPATSHSLHGQEHPIANEGTAEDTVASLW